MRKEIAYKEVRVLASEEYKLQSIINQYMEENEELRLVSILPAKNNIPYIRLYFEVLLNLTEEE